MSATDPADEREKQEGKPIPWKLILVLTVLCAPLLGMAYGYFESNSYGRSKRSNPGSLGLTAFLLGVLYLVFGQQH